MSEGLVDPPPIAGNDGLGARAARGGAVTLVGQLLRIIVQMGAVVVLARLLSPDDYGLVAMVLIIVGVGEIFRDFGLSSAAIQAPSLSVRQRDNLFWINAAIGLALSVVVLVLSPAFAALFGPRQLLHIIQVLSATFLINGLTTQYRASLNRQMKFKQLAVADVSTQALGLAVAIACAALGAGYWALVAQQLSAALSLFVCLAIFGRWIPGRYSRGVEMKGFLRYGWNLMATQIVGYVTNNIDTIVVSFRFGPGPLGFYNRAFQLLMNPLGQVRNPTTSVALPVLAGLRDDVERAGTFIRKGQLALGYSMVAGLGLAAGAASPLVNLFLGPQWRPVVPVFVLLALAGIFQTLAFVGYWVYLSRGLTAELFRYSLLQLVIKAVCIGVGSMWGIVGVAAGYAIAPALEWPLSLWWLSRLTVIPRRELWFGALRLLALALTAAACSGCVVWLVPVSTILELLLAALAAGLVYALAYVLCAPVRRDLVDVLGMARQVLNRATKS